MVPLLAPRQVHGPGRSTSSQFYTSIVSSQLHMKSKKLNGKPINLLEEEFNLSVPATSSSKDLPTRFSSPPLMPGLLQSLQETLGKDAMLTAIQALSMKKLFKECVEGKTYKESLLASETGSGKSIAYLLPVLQDLKHMEQEQSNTNFQPSTPTPSNPRALVLAPTHELTRQLANFAKTLSHVIKLCIMCASKANTLSAPKFSGTASKMKEKFEICDFKIVKAGDLLVGTPMKLFEMEQFWADELKMGLESVQWVVVDEADVLFDPDFQESTCMLLGDIAAARGSPVPVIPSSVLSSTPDSEATTTISHPFNFLLTSAIIPTSLAIYLSNYYPPLTRLASPQLHHLPPTLRTEHTSWTGRSKNVDIERRIRCVWAEDALVHSKTATGPGPVKLSKLLIFCNKCSKVKQVAAFLDGRRIKCVALTSGAETRKWRSNHHLDRFLKTGGPVLTGPGVYDLAQTPHVLVTTSLLSCWLDFSPMIKHVFIAVVFGRAKGRGSGRTEEVKEKVRAVAG
ncbi:DEAD-domain-containing protein [Suillus hirtellus]|nr:DEAD-domain-containing protein [Suillus hirtellus]